MRKPLRVRLPDGLETIGRQCFYQISLEKIVLPASVAEVGTEAFCGCERLVQVAFGRVETTKDKSSGTQAVPASSLKVICANAFNRYTGLRGVEFPDGLAEIGVGTSSESGLEGVTMPPSMRTICQGAFHLCRNMKRVALNEGLDVLGTDEYPEDGGLWCGVFEESAVETVQLPSTLRMICYCAFEGCKGLRGITLPEGLEEVGRGAFKSSGKKLPSETPRSELRVIGDEAFCGCEFIRAIELPDGLEEIGLRAFRERS